MSPFWPSLLPKNRRPSWPRFREALACDVAIVGGGLAGCASAYLFAAAGARTCLLEADRIGLGATGAGIGLMRPTPNARFADLERLYGRRAARRIWEMSRHAALDFAALLRRLKIPCSLEPCDVVAVAGHDEDETLLRRDYKAIRTAGLDAAWLTAARVSRELGIEARGGLRFGGAFRFDPYRACLGLSRAASARGARLFEQSPVLRVRAGRRGVEVETRGGPIAARSVVIATGGPTSLFKSLQRHFDRTHTYAALTPALDGPLRRQLGRADAAVTVGAGASRVLSRTTDGRLLFAGADQPHVPDRARRRSVVQRTGQLMYELSLLYPAISGLPPHYGWDAGVANTRDGVMYAGLHRNYPQHLFAVGTGHNGPAAAYLAARILARRYAEAPAAGDELFGFTR